MADTPDKGGKSAPRKVTAEQAVKVVKLLDAKERAKFDRWVIGWMKPVMSRRGT